MSAWQNESRSLLSLSLSLSASPWSSGRLIDRCDGWMDGWMVRQKPILWKGRSTSASELLERLGDVPLIAATTVAVSPSVSHKRDGQSVRPSVGEKGYLPLNTLNKVNRKRAQKGEKREERRRGEETAASSDAQCGRAGGTGTARSNPSFAESFVNWGWGCTMLGRHRRQAATTDERERERERGDRMTRSSCVSGFAAG